MYSLPASCWSLRPVPRAYSSSTPQLSDRGAVSNPCGYQERRAEGIAVLGSLTSMGFKTGAGGRFPQAPSPQAAVRIAAPALIGCAANVEAFFIISPQRNGRAPAWAARSFRATRTEKVAYNCRQSITFRYFRRVPSRSAHRRRQAHAAPQGPDLPLCGEGVEALRVLGQADVRAAQL